MEEFFTCDKYHLKMPEATADDFCARRHQKAQEGDFCLVCNKGIMAAKKSIGIEQGGGMAKNVSAKKCVDCGKEYKPTSGIQKRCPECKANKKTCGNKVESKPKKVKSNGHCDTCEHLQCERVMVALNLCSFDNFEKARKIIRELNS